MPRSRLARTFEAAGGLACIAVAGTLAGACMLSGETRIAHGYTYTSGNATYDAFFRDVHQQQSDAAGWNDERQGAKRALVANLELTAETPDVTIVQTTHESASKVAKGAGSLHLVEEEGAAPHVVASNGAGEGASLFHALEETARLELEIAKHRRAAEPKLEALSKQEADLEGRVKTDFSQLGGGKQSEVTAELAATKDAVSKMKARAEVEARESEDFVADLGRALETASDEKRAEPRRSRPPRKRDDAVAAPPPPKKNAATTPDQPAPPPKPAPAPKPADTGEVFTP